MSKNSVVNHTVLVTGASGALGRPLVAALQKAGYTVMPLSQADADITEYEELRSALATHSFDTVIHLAALTRTHQKAEYERVNVAGTQNMLAAARTCGAKRFIFMSSRANTSTCGAYGNSKGRAEELVRASNIPWIILQPAEVYGGDSGDAITTLVDLGKRFGIVLKSASTITLSPVHIDDVVDATVRAVASPHTGRSYVLAGPEEFSLAELGERATQKKYMIRVPAPLWLLRTIALFAQMLGSTSMVPDQVDRYMCDKPTDSTAAHTDLGFAPRPFIL